MLTLHTLACVISKERGEEEGEEVLQKELEYQVRKVDKKSYTRETKGIETSGSPD